MSGLCRFSYGKRLGTLLASVSLIALFSSTASADSQNRSTLSSTYSLGSAYALAQDSRSNKSRAESKPLNANQADTQKGSTVIVLADDPIAISYYKRYLPALAALLKPLIYLTLGLCLGLLVLSFLLPLGRAWFLVSRLLGVLGASLIICAILLGVYLLFFARTHPDELAKIDPRGRQEINFKEAGPYSLFKGRIDPPSDFRYTIRSRAGEVIAPDKRAEKFDSSFLHPSQYEKVGHLELEHPGVYEITTSAQARMAAAPLFIARDYAGEFEAGLWLALLIFTGGVSLWYFGRAIAGAAALKLHRKRLARGFQLLHNQKGRTPGRISSAHIKIYDQALALKRKFSEREIPRQSITSIEKIKEMRRSSMPPFGNIYFEGIKINYQARGSDRSTTFWSDSYLTHDGGTDRKLRQKLKEAGYPVRW